MTRDEAVTKQIAMAMAEFPFEAYHAALVNHHKTDPGRDNGGLTYSHGFSLGVSDMQENAFQLLRDVASRGVSSIESGFLRATRHECKGSIMLELCGIIESTSNEPTEFTEGKSK